MRYLTNAACLVAAIMLGLVATIRPAHAYLDPGTGSYATQVALAGIAALLFTARTLIRTVAQFLRTKFGPGSAARTVPSSDVVG